MKKTVIALTFLAICLGVFLTNAQVFIPMAFWGAQPPDLLDISDPVTYSYGLLATNTNANKTFVVSNTSLTKAATSMSGAAFSSTNFTWAGGTYPGGGTCGSALSADSSCTVTVRANSPTGTTTPSTIGINYYNSVSVIQAKRPIIAQFITAPVRLTFINPPSYIRVSTCTAVTVQAQDDNGNAINVGANITVSLVINNANNTNFYTTNTCGTIATTRTITTGTNSVTFYIQSTTANQSGIMVATTPGLFPGEANFLVTNAPTRLYIVVAPQIKTNVCRELIVYSVDNNYFPAQVTGATAIGGGTTGSNGFYTDSTCGTAATSPSIAAGTYSTTIYIRNATAQTVTLTATAAGLTNGTATVVFSASLTWYNAFWARRIRITINNADQATAHTNIPVLVSLNPSIINYSQMQASGNDIRFVAADNSTVLPHQIDTWAPGAESQIWVRVGNLAASTQNNYIYMYYGNILASNSQSGANTFSSLWSTWHLNEDPAATAPQYKDALTTRNGTAANSPTRVKGVIGFAAGLTGTTDAIDINSNLATALGGSSTMSFWVRTAQTGNNTMWQAPGITGVEEAGGGNDIFFGWLDATGYIGVTAGNGADAKSAFIVNNDAWRHVTITRDSTSGAVQFFINGVLNGSATSEAGAKTTYFDLLGEIGNTGGAGVNFNGALDEVRIYNSVQTTARIQADFKYMMDTHLIYSLMEVP